MLSPGSKGLLAVGASVQGHVQVAEVMEGLAPTLTGSGLAGVHWGFLFAEVENTLSTGP